MRLFTGIELSPNTLHRVGGLLALVRPVAQLRWTPVENLHITTTFIGGWPAERVPELKDALGGVLTPQPFSVDLAEISFFPNTRSPRVLLIGIRPNALLATLAEQTAIGLEKLGIAQETRPYTPHLTLARIRRPTSLKDLRLQLDQIAYPELGSFTVSGFALFESQSTPRGSLYRRLASFPLSNTLNLADKPILEQMLGDAGAVDRD